MKQYGGYLFYLGIVFALASTFIDQGSNFFVRYLGTDPDAPLSLVPFIQGLVVAPLTIIYILIFDRDCYKKFTTDSVLYALAGATISWMSQEMLNAGASVSKSGLGTMGFQIGIVVPICYDVISGKRELMFIDVCGIIIIFLVQF